MSPLEPPLAAYGPAISNFVLTRDMLMSEKLKICCFISTKIDQLKERPSLLSKSQKLINSCLGNGQKVHLFKSISLIMSFGCRVDCFLISLVASCIDPSPTLSLSSNFASWPLATS